VGHIQKRGDRKYQARWLDPDGRERAQTFPRKVDAERHLASVEGAKLTGTYVDRSNMITVSEYARQWAAARPHRESTAARTATMIKTHIEATPLGSRRLVALRPSEVQAWATERSRRLSPSTLRLVVGTLRSIFNAAVRDLLVAHNPAVGLSLPRHERERIVPLTVDQVRALAAAMPPRCQAMVITQAGLGLRLGELLALRLEDVDFLRRTVRVEWQTTVDGKHRVLPKTPRSRRTLPLPAVVADALAAHIAEWPSAADGSLFYTLHGLPHRHEYYGSRIFAPAVRKAGLPSGTTSHDLRHHYASVLLAAGESVVAVAERLGHENATLVLTTYGHLLPDSEDRTRRAIDAAWISDGPGTDGGDASQASSLVSG
jgi:integrase